MKKNISTVDMVIRILVAVVFVALYLMQVVTGTIGIVLLVLAVVFAVTGFISFCPIYWLLGLNFRDKKE